MREIKFRAWDKDFKTMHWFLEKSHELPTPQPLHSYLEMRERFDVMQYTGFKDKNGKKIYEGDILEDEEQSKFQVCFDEELGQWRFCNLSNSDENYALYNELESFDYEVIGNIYENTMT